jgi:hypothetical protein
MNLDTLITIGYFISSLGFLIATLYTLDAVRKSGPSALKNVLCYLFIGTATFFIITVFQGLGGDFFGIPDASMDFWWHIMFYMAMFSYYLGFKALVGLGTSSIETAPKSSGAKVWGIISLIALVVIFIIPKMAEPTVLSYTSSRLAEFGLHHFIAFVMAGIVGAYLLSAKIFLGQIGKAIANPMILAIWAFGLQHLWELLNESWKVVIVSSNTGEGVEKIFLVIASIAIIFATIKLKSFAKA